MIAYNGFPVSVTEVEHGEKHVVAAFAHGM